MKTHGIPNIKLKDGDTFFVSIDSKRGFTKGTTIHSDGTKTNHGGKRKGAGRKKKEPTKVIRVPVSKLPAILKIIK